MLPTLFGVMCGFTLMRETACIFGLTPILTLIHVHLHYYSLVTATLVSKENAKGNREGVQDAVSQALMIGIVIALIGTPLTFFNPEKVLSAVLRDQSPAMQYARPYLLIRAFAFLPSIMSLIGFSAFRGACVHMMLWTVLLGYDVRSY